MYFAKTWKTSCSPRPPGRIAVLGIDPGIRTGCKIAVVDDTGKFLEHYVIYPLHAEATTMPVPRERWNR